MISPADEIRQALLVFGQEGRVFTSAGEGKTTVVVLPKNPTGFSADRATLDLGKMPQGEVILYFLPMGQEVLRGDQVEVGGVFYWITGTKVYALGGKPLCVKAKAVLMEVIE